MEDTIMGDLCAKIAPSQASMYIFVYFLYKQIFPSFSCITWQYDLHMEWSQWSDYSVSMKAYVGVIARIYISNDQQMIRYTVYNPIQSLVQPTRAVRPVPKTFSEGVSLRASDFIVLCQHNQILTQSHRIEPLLEYRRCLHGIVYGLHGRQPILTIMQ